jgi:hypothetical protein
MHLHQALRGHLVYGLRTYLARQLIPLFQRCIFVCMGPALMPGSSAACQAAPKQPSVLLHFLTEQDEMRFREGSKRSHCQVIFGMYPSNGVPPWSRDPNEAIVRLFSACIHPMEYRPDRLADKPWLKVLLTDLLWGKILYHDRTIHVWIQVARKGTLWFYSAN